MSDIETESDDQEDKSINNSQEVVKMVVRKKIATTPISILIESLVKNLCTMIETDEKRALKIYNIICTKLHEMKLIDESYRMTEFEGMRGQYERALYRLVKAARGGEELPKSIERMWLSDELHSEWSHYQREFEEINFIAGGGFGQVFRVRHKLDGTEYAVKKIYIRSNGIKSVMNYLAEVKTFASLNHSNIVQYKAAWLELGVPTAKNALKPPEISSEVTKSSYSKITKSYLMRKKSSSGFTVEFEHSRKYSHSNETVSPRRLQESRNSISEGGKAICKISTDDLVEELTNPHENWATLYIQMALCQITLKNWLEKRNQTELPEEINEHAVIQHAIIPTKVRRDTVLHILRQLLRGLQYIHSRGVVHHDIKPSNIFLQFDEGNLCVQLGDFGLACPLQNTEHCLAIGTKLYAAPEQLQGKCNSKSDMYSLGIVLLELVETFRTDMERVRCISELRKGRLPSHMTAREPQLAQIISQLVSKYPNNRPDASKLLDTLTIHPDDSELVCELKTQITEKDNEIRRLKELLKVAGIEF